MAEPLVEPRREDLDAPATIGRLNESALHAALKRYLACPGDLLEAKVDGYVVDVVRGDLLIEVQTRSFAAIRPKLRRLLAKHRVRLVYPVAVARWIVRVSPETGEILGRRRSPRRGTPMDLFDELIRLPELLEHPNLVVEVLLTHQEEVRVADGRGSWRRRGVSIHDRRLLEVVGSLTLASPADLWALLPADLPPRLTNRDLAELAGIPVVRAQRATYCLRRAGVLQAVGRRGRLLLYERSPLGEEDARTAAADCAGAGA